MADNTLVNEEGLLTTSPSILAEIANNPAEDSLLALDDEDIPCGQMSTERLKNTNLQENGDQPLQRNGKTNNTERRNSDPTEVEISDKETTFLETYIYKGEDLKETQSLMCVLISNQLRHFGIPILLSVTRKELKKASLKGKPFDSSEQTLPN